MAKKTGTKKQSAKQGARKKPRLRNTKTAIAARFPPSYQFHWRAGPYHAPTVSVGAVLRDEWRGDVTVEGFTDAPIPWPAARSQHYPVGAKPLLPILCGDLVRAVCEEDELTVSHYWGVSRYIVEQWKRAISGATDPNAVMVGLAFKRENPAFRKKFGYK
ncbi:MAG: hypothetical protein KJZ78_20565 [Bryobacteraceae bacterium]|nr:hypothetical protein [Bryobacteraceae bacterium]